MRIKFTEEEKRLFDYVRPYAASKGGGIRPDAPTPMTPIHKDSCDLSDDNQDN